MVKSTSSNFVPESEASDSSSSSSSKFKGVRKRKWGKYVSEIRLPNSRERIWLGSYDTPEKAARAFDAALLCLRGRNAKFNFPENPPEIANGRSMSPGEVQEAAGRYAHSGDSNPRAVASSELTPTRTESPCPSVSYGTAQLDNDFSNIPLDNAFLDQFMAMGNENKVHDFGAFPGYDDFFMPPPVPNVDYWPDTTEEISSGTSFLWNF